jgi:hypothetical protein
MMNTKNYFLTAMLAAVLTAMMTVSCSTNDNPIVIPETPEIPGGVGGSPDNTVPSNIVRGQVKDENGDAIIGATVRVVGTRLRTLTDNKGYFTLDVQGNGTLEVSYIGYKTSVLPFSVGQTLGIVLEEEDSALPDIIVVI